MKQTNQKKINFFTIIIIGGSQGAKIFDTLINEILSKNFKKMFFKSSSSNK